MTPEQTVNALQGVLQTHAAAVDRADRLHVAGLRALAQGRTADGYNMLAEAHEARSKAGAEAWDAASQVVIGAMTPPAAPVPPGPGVGPDEEGG